MNTDNQVTGNAGLYYVCYKLSCMGWNVMPTARNARGLDIVAYGQDGSRFLGIQVKTLNSRNPVPLGKSLNNLMGDFWIAVYNISGSPTAFIMTPGEVKSLAHRGEKDGRISFWLQPPSYEKDTFRDRWDRIGAGSPRNSP
jgi:hypothetical protein